MTAPNPNQNPGPNGAPGPNAAPSTPNAAPNPNLPPWANQNTINNPTAPRSLRAELQHHATEVAPLLQELNEEEVKELDQANRLYHATYEDAYEQAYNALDNAALRADPKNKINSSRDLMSVKRKIAQEKARQEALDILDEYAIDQMMPAFAGMIDQHDPRYWVLHDSIMHLGSMDEEAWIGDSSANIPGLRDGLWEVTQSGSGAETDTINNTPETTEPTAEELEKAQKIAELTEKLAAIRELTTKARDKYAQLSGEQRNGHLGRVTGTRFRDKLMLLLTAGVSAKKSEQMDANVEAARNEYSEAFKEEYKLLKELTEAEGLEGQELKKKLMDFQLDHQLQLETKILAEQKLRGTESWLAKKWTKSGKFGKFLMVALPATLVGLTGGLAAAGLGLAGAAGVAATSAIGAGTTYLGRKTGHAIAGKAGRDFANTDLAAEWFDEKKALDAANLTAAIERAPGDELVDHTTSVEEETERRVKMNRRRRERAGALGSIAAGIGFFGGRIAGGRLFGNGLLGHDSTAQHGLRSGDNLIPNPHDNVPPAAPGAEHAQHAAHAFSSHVNQYPWTDAHYLTPGNEFPTMQHAMDAWNQAHAGAANLHFVNIGNTTQIYDGARALNKTQQTAFNIFMERVTSR